MRTVEKAEILRQIGAKISYHRKIQNMTQADLANKISIAYDTLGRIERGKYNDNIAVPMLIEIAEGLGVDFDVFLKFTDEEKELWRKRD